MREVIGGDMDHPVPVESFTIPQASEALGRSLATIRRWLEDDKIPAPVLRDVQRHHAVYSVGELEVIARAVGQFENDFSYLATANTQIVEILHQAIHAYRSQFI